jgi:predicted glycoside hydrolase/deacetylase ChbG (UPF0249 family)
MMKPALAAAAALLTMSTSPHALAGRDAAAPRSLAERLGFSPTDKVLIVNADDVGVSHASVAATIAGMERGLMTSATIMVPCPWFPRVAEYARAHPKADFGLHLTHTSEWQSYKWGPVASRTDVPGLVDPQGYLWPDTKTVYEHATPAEAEIEARAQIAKARAAGIDVTHLDSHMGVLHFDVRYHQVYRKLARELDLPIRMPSRARLESVGAGYLLGELAGDGTLHPDFLNLEPRRPDDTTESYWKRTLSNLQPGVTEVLIHPAVPTEEMQHITGEAPSSNWRVRGEEYRLFTEDAGLRALLESQHVKRIGYRALRDLQRSARGPHTSDVSR